MKKFLFALIVFALAFAVPVTIIALMSPESDLDTRNRAAEEESDPAGYEHNSPPEVVSVPTTRVYVGQRYNYVLKVRDDDGDAVAVSVDEKPDWLVWDEELFVLSGVAGADTDVGSYSIEFTVSDGSSLVSHSFALEVDEDDTSGSEENEEESDVQGEATVRSSTVRGSTASRSADSVQESFSATPSGPSGNTSGAISPEGDAGSSDSNGGNVLSGSAVSGSSGGADSIGSSSNELSRNLDNRGFLVGSTVSLERTSSGSGVLGTSSVSSGTSASSVASSGNSTDFSGNGYKSSFVTGGSSGESQSNADEAVLGASTTYVSNHTGVIVVSLFVASFFSVMFWLYMENSGNARVFSGLAGSMPRDPAAGGTGGVFRRGDNDDRDGTKIKKRRSVL